eukprot:ANDGO_06068.mRNA.1 hypothetical protein
MLRKAIPFAWKDLWTKGSLAVACVFIVLYLLSFPQSSPKDDYLDTLIRTNANNALSSSFPSLTLAPTNNLPVPFFLPVPAWNNPDPRYSTPLGKLLPNLAAIVSYARAIDPESVMIDVGVEWGTETLLAASLGMRVVGIEGSLYMSRAVQAAIVFNGFSDHAEVLNAAVSQSEGSRNTVVFAERAADGRSHMSSLGGCIAEGDTSSCFDVEVPALSLDFLHETRGYGKVGIMKLDCEGCETVALKSAANILRRNLVRFLVIEVFLRPNWDGWWEDRLRLVLEAGFDSFYLEGPGIELALTEVEQFFRETQSEDAGAENLYACKKCDWNVILSAPIRKSPIATA